MYEKRVRIFIIASLAMLAVLLLRLIQMQLLADSRLQDEIAALKAQWHRQKQLKTVRGRILDRRGRVLAADVPRFQLRINYQLTRFLDSRVVEARRSEVADDQTGEALEAFDRTVAARAARLNALIAKCAKFGPTEEEISARIAAINDKRWDLRTYLAWLRHEPDPNLVASYDSVNNIPLSEARTDFERRVPDGRRRDALIIRVDDIPSMYADHWLLDLETEDAIFAAQLEFMDVNEVTIQPQGHRSYPYGSVAAQTIGWVAPASQDYQKALFEHDRLASYLQGDVCGMRGVEYVCESILRGRRGERVLDIDRQVIREVEAEFGRDVTLTLDIDLQQRLETLLAEPGVNPEYYDASMAAVVLDIPSGDILAMISLPAFDLNDARSRYDDLLGDPNNPLTNRCLYGLYPPGSVVKPVVLVAGLESGQITPATIINCPAQPAPPGWPNCWIWRKSHIGHDNQWSNNARNAIRGSCNIYFSHLADDL
jgi:cell division protein FtsI/penicillin-binding protein 2